MHCREPAAAKNKYWWRKVGNHPGLNRLREFATEVGYDYRHSFQVSDYCEHIRGPGTQEEITAQVMQLLECQLFFDHGYRQSINQDGIVK